MPKATALFNTNWKPYQVSSQVKWVKIEGEVEDVRIVVILLLDRLYPNLWIPEPHEGSSFEQFNHADANLGDYILASIHIEKEVKEVS